MVKMREALLKGFLWEDICNHLLPRHSPFLFHRISVREQEVGCRTLSAKAGKITGMCIEMRILHQSKIYLKSIHMGELGLQSCKLVLANSW